MEVLRKRSALSFSLLAQKKRPLLLSFGKRSALSFSLLAETSMHMHMHMPYVVLRYVLLLDALEAALLRQSSRQRQERAYLQRTLLAVRVLYSTRGLNADGFHIYYCLIHSCHRAQAAPQATHDTCPAFDAARELDNVQRRTYGCASDWMRLDAIAVITEPSCPFSSPFWPLLPPSPASAVTKSPSARRPRHAAASKDR